MSFQNIFSKRIRQLRIDKGLNQPQLAIELGKPRQTISNWEIGTRIPPLETLCELASYFNVTLDYLTGYDYLSGNSPDMEAI
jgi:transcriptional regulator with XRE-family HTH domain